MTLWLALACAYQVELTDTGIRPLGRPVMELSTHESVGPPATADGWPTDWTFAFDIRNTGDADLVFETAGVWTLGATMCMELGPQTCPGDPEPLDTGAGAVLDTGHAPNERCNTYLSPPDLPPGCTRAVRVGVEADAPIGVLRIAALRGPWAPDPDTTTSERVEGPAYLAQDFVQEIVVRPADWTAPPILALTTAGGVLPYATSGVAEVRWRLQNVGATPVTFAGIETTCAAYAEVSTPTGTVIAPDETADVVGLWTYSVGASACEARMLSDADPVIARVRVLPEPWLGEPGLAVTTPAPGAALGAAAELVVTATLADPQEARAWSATLQDLGGTWQVHTTRTGPGDLSFTVPAGTLPTGVDTLQVVATEGTRRVVASVPVLVDAAAAGDDADGWAAADGDCDDTNAATYPGAAEVVDGQDNDCDSVVDDGTTASDDDGDGRTEADGDRDDADVTVYDGAPELCDGLDNDGNDLVDDGTVCGDDDSDGWTELDGDCDDDDRARHPETTDRCGEDDNCDHDSRRCPWDEGLYVIGLGVERDVCLPGDELAVHVYAWGADAVSLSDTFGGTFDATGLLEFRYACPEVVEPTSGELSVTASADGAPGWAQTAEVILLPEGYDLDAPIHVGAPHTPWCGCEAMTVSGAGLGVLGLLGWGLRRRR